MGFWARSMWYNANRNVSLQIGSGCCLLLHLEQDIEGGKEEEDENETSCSDLTGQLYCYCGRFFHGWMMECSSCLDLRFLMQEDFPIGEINVTLEYCSSIWWTWLLTNHNRRRYAQNKNRNRAQTTSAIRVRMSTCVIVPSVDSAIYSHLVLEVNRFYMSSLHQVLLVWPKWFPGLYQFVGEPMEWTIGMNHR